MAIKFSIPNIPSLTKTKPDSFNVIFVPDVKYLLKFSKGDLGIADAMKTSTILNTTSSAKNTSVLGTYLKLAGGIIDSPEKYIKNGKYSIPQSAISLDTSSDQAGVKALEKSIIQSIFDSQKPYMDMVSQLSDVLISVEDIIARVLALASKSLKPATNPRALGYKKEGKVSTKDELAKLNSLTKNSSDSTNQKSNTNISSNGNIPNDKHWEVKSTVYSTGTFKPDVNYTYEYIDIINTDPIISGTTSDVSVSKLPKTLIIAVFDNEGNLINDNSINNDTYNLSWLKNSKKWFGNFNYLSDNDETNVSLFNQYYNEYALENLPTSLDETSKKNVIDKVTEFNSSDNYKNIKEQISSLKTDCYFASVKYTNSNLLDSVNIPKKAFAPKKINFNGNNMWIDPESDYDLKLIRCDVADKSNDNDITNTNPYSNGVYGGDDENNEIIGQIYRTKNNDKNSDEITKKGLKYHKTYYILEGIDNENNNQSDEIINGNNKNTNGSGGFSYYKKKAFFSAPKQFIKMIIKIASKLSPAIAAISKIGTDPVKFVTDIMKSNLGDNNGTKDVKFIFFSSEFLKKFSSLNGSSNKSKVIKNSVLKNFVVINKDGSHKFLLNGSGFSFLRKIKIGHSISSNLSFDTFSSVYPVTPTPNNIANSSLGNNINYNNLKFTSYKETETIDYIGGYDPNKTYKYIYVTEYILGILQDGQKLEDSGDLEGALSKYSEAQKLDPANKTITDKIDTLKKLKSAFGGNALFSFILNLITLPLEIVLGIVDEVLKILKKFSSPTKLQEAISDLVSFKIFPGGLNPIDFFKPTNMLKLAKISFNIELFMSWISTIFIKPLEEYDLNKIIQLPFVDSFPKYNYTQFKSLIFGHGGGKNKPNILPLKMLTGILKIFEGIINAIISFFWALMGIEGLLKKPKLKFTKDSNTDISPSDIQALVNGTYTDVIDPNSDNGESNYNFIYNVQLPDGRTLRQLNQIELEQFIQDNNNFTYQYKL